MPEQFTSSPKKLYAFDFDSTLGKVRTSTDNEMIRLIASYTYISQSEVLRTASEDVRPYSITDHIRMLHRSIGFDQDPNKILNHVHQFLQSEFATILYPETVRVLTTLKKRGNILGIITYGGVDYQRLKISASGIDKLVDFSEVTQKALSKGEVIDKISVLYPEHSIIYVDNSLDELNSIARLGKTKAHLVHIAREGLISEDDKNAFSKITSLDQLV